MVIEINHDTVYKFAERPFYALQQARLTPFRDAGQEPLNWSLELEGARVEVEYTDQHGNHVHLLRLDCDAEVIKVRASGKVDSRVESGVTGAHRGPAPLWHYLQPTELTELGKLTRALARKAGKPEKADALMGMHRLSDEIRTQLPYSIGVTTAETSAEEAMEAGGAVCQDHAHVMLAIARHWGYPARYVSGYLKINDIIDQEASHAWAEVYLENLGWVGFDVSNGYSPDGRYVRIAYGRDYADAAPLSGVQYGGAAAEMLVTLQVQQ